MIRSRGWTIAGQSFKLQWSSLVYSGPVQTFENQYNGLGQTATTRNCFRNKVQARAQVQPHIFLVFSMGEIESKASDSNFVH